MPTFVYYYVHVFPENFAYINNCVCVMCINKDCTL